MKGTAAYNATKEGIRALTRTAANEWGRYNIYVNCLVPTIVTDSAQAFFDSRPGVQDKLVDTLGSYDYATRKRVLEDNATELYNLKF